MGAGNETPMNQKPKRSDQNFPHPPPSLPLEGGGANLTSFFLPFRDEEQTRMVLCFKDQQRMRKLCWHLPTNTGILVNYNKILNTIFAIAISTTTLVASAQMMTDDERAKIWTEAKAAAKNGPQDISLGNQATLKLPLDRIFVPQPQAAKLMHAMGNPGDDPGLQGLIFPAGEAPWFATLRFESSGYVKDDDAKDWNADDLLKGYQEGTEAANAERAKMGVGELEVLGWAEKPAYNQSAHRLVWAMSTRSKGAPASEAQGVNYNTYALGREGYFSLNLITSLDRLPAHKPVSAELLSALQFADGKRYADFNASSDKVAEYGLAALVVGVAAKKLGLFAMVAVFLAKFAKIGFLAAAGIGSLVLGRFRKKPPVVAPSMIASDTNNTPPSNPSA